MSNEMFKVGIIDSEIDSDITMEIPKIPIIGDMIGYYVKDDYRAVYVHDVQYYFNIDNKYVRADLFVEQKKP